MRKTLLLVSLSAIVVSLAVVFSYGVKEKAVLSFNVSADYGILQVPAVDLVGLHSEIFAPVFSNNFNGLVVFPELGSGSVSDGFLTVIRGPPKNCIFG